MHPKRLGILRHNLLRCGFTNLYTQRLRPDQWAELAPGVLTSFWWMPRAAGSPCWLKAFPTPAV
ncbi:MAG: hypothetical protein ACLT38_12305 [Akkermansia sp.]